MPAMKCNRQVLKSRAWPLLQCFKFEPLFYFQHKASSAKESIWVLALLIY